MSTGSSSAGSRTLARGLAVLQALATDAEGATVAGLASRTGLDRAVLYRLLGTLEDGGYVVRDPYSRRYRLGVSLIELGARAARSLEVRRHALPGMRALLEQARETVCLAVRDRDQVVLVDRLDPPGRQARVGYPVGYRQGLADGAYGRALLITADGEMPAGGDLAPKPEEQARGFSISDGEGSTAVASPIRDRAGSAVASVSLTVATGRVHDSAMLGPPVRALAQEISRRLGYEAPGQVVAR
jgi:DNA-binding IclR family transcriptional regulator